MIRMISRVQWKGFCRGKGRGWHPCRIAGIVLFCMVLAAGVRGFWGPSRPTVEADFAPLRTAVAVSIGDNLYKFPEIGPSTYPFFSGRPPGIKREHAKFVALLKEQGVEVLDALELLEEAVANARRAGELGDWVRRTFPVTADRLTERLEGLTAADILYRRDDFYYGQRDEAGDFSPLFSGFSSIYWARDFAVSTPKGIVIGNGVRYSRALENDLIRLILTHSDRLRGVPVIFDAREEGVHLDGGDVIVWDSETLLVGVGNRSSHEAARKLAQRLQMNVIAVAMPPAEEPNFLRRPLLHLDSMFNIVDRRTVVAVPFFLEKDAGGPVQSILRGMARQIESLHAARPGVDVADSAELLRTVELVPQVGWVTRFDAATGKETPLDMKLVDWARDQDFRVVYVGGERGDLEPEKWAIERVLFELRWQGANVLQLGPGKVIAYEHNVHTNRALEKAGVQVLTFPGELLSIAGGGPHCLLMPLVRRFDPDGDSGN